MTIINKTSSDTFHLDKCPIEESILELRFVSSVPPEAVFGIIYNSISSLVKSYKLVNMPVLQIPESIRASEPEFKYSLHYRLFKENFSIGIGPNIIAFSNIAPYIGWDSFISKIMDILNPLFNINLFRSIERTGLRYINYFNDSLYNVSDLMIKIPSVSDYKLPFSFKTDFVKNDFNVVLNLHNQIDFQINNISKKGSIIDIDVFYQFDICISEAYSEFNNIINAAHLSEKELFYSLVKSDYVLSTNSTIKEHL